MGNETGPSASALLYVEKKKLLAAIDAHFNLEELRTLSFNLDIEYDNLPANSKKGKARELIEYCENRSRLQNLLELCKVERPNVDWDAFIIAKSDPELLSERQGQTNGAVDQNKRDEAGKPKSILALATLIIVVLLVVAVLLADRILLNEGEPRPPRVIFVHFVQFLLVIGLGAIILYAAYILYKVVIGRTNNIGVHAIALTASAILVTLMLFAIPALNDLLPAPDVSFRESAYKTEEGEAKDITVVLDNPRILPPLEIKISDEADEAELGSDYEIEPGSGLTFVSWFYDSFYTFTVKTFDDGEYDPSEEVRFQLNFQQKNSDEDKEVKLTIKDKGEPPPTVSFKERAIEVIESQEEAEFTVELDRSWPYTMPVVYETSDITATEGKDYEAVQGKLSFAPGEVSKTIAIPIMLDKESGEVDEGVRLELTYLQGQRVEAELTIKDHPPPILSFKESAIEVVESQEEAEFMVELNGEWPDTITVAYETSDITATAGEDYEAVKGELIFTPGEVSQAIAIPIKLDEEGGEVDERVRLELTYLQGQRVEAELTIKDHPPPILSFKESAIEVIESQEEAEFTVELNGEWPDTITVPYETSDITATAGEDYEAVRGELIFTPGEVSQIIIIPINDDSHRELNEELEVSLGDAPFLTTESETSSSKLIIEDDGDTETACNLPTEERKTTGGDIVVLGFRVPGLYLRSEPDDTEDENIQKVVMQEEIMCVIDKIEEGRLWYRVRLTDAVTDGWIGAENVYEIIPPRLRYVTGTVSIPFFAIESYPGCRDSDDRAIVGNVRESDILRVIDRDSNSNCFKVALTIDKRVGWVQSKSINKNIAAPVEFKDENAELELKDKPAGSHVENVRQEQILWASASALDENCLIWYKMQLKDGNEGWLGGGVLMSSDALQQLHQDISLCR